MDNKNTTTFGKDHKRRFKCRKCGAYFGTKGGDVVYSYLSDKKTKYLKCKKCGHSDSYAPPQILKNKTNEPVVYWNANERGLEGVTTLIDDEDVDKC